MSKVQMLRSLVNQRLTAAAEEIFGLFEKTIAEYKEELSRSKEENERQRRLLDAVFNQEVRMQRAAAQQLLVVKEEVPPEQQDWRSSLDQEDPEPPHFKEDQEDLEPPHIKEEQEELWTSQDGEQFLGLEEAGIKLSFTPLKSEDDEEEAQSSQLYQRQAEQMETEADGADCRGSEPDRKVDPERYRDWKGTQEPQSDSNPLQNNEVLVSDVLPVLQFTLISPPKCARSSDHRRRVEIYTSAERGVSLYSCSVCSKRIKRKGDLTRHMTIHTREKLFSCSVCSKTFSQKRHMKRHMTIHTGERPFSCSLCAKTFSQKRNLTRHMTIHTGVKPFCCSVCGKSLKRKRDLQLHMNIHTGEKPFSCSVCTQTFTHKRNLTSHMTTHTKEKAFCCSV